MIMMTTWQRLHSCIKFFLIISLVLHLKTEYADKKNNNNNVDVVVYEDKNLLVCGQCPVYWVRNANSGDFWPLTVVDGGLARSTRGRLVIIVSLIKQQGGMWSSVRSSHRVLLFLYSTGRLGWELKRKISRRGEICQDSIQFGAKTRPNENVVYLVQKWPTSAN